MVALALVINKRPFSLKQSKVSKNSVNMEKEEIRE